MRFRAHVARGVLLVVAGDELHLAAADTTVGVELLEEEAGPFTGRSEGLGAERALLGGDVADEDRVGRHPGVGSGVAAPTRAGCGRTAAATTTLAAAATTAGRASAGPTARGASADGLGAAGAPLGAGDERVADSLAAGPATDRLDALTTGGSHEVVVLEPGATGGGGRDQQQAEDEPRATHVQQSPPVALVLSIRGACARPTVRRNLLEVYSPVGTNAPATAYAQPDARVRCATAQHTPWGTEAPSRRRSLPPNSYWGRCSGARSARGIPRIRSAMIVFWISLVPPATVTAEVKLPLIMACVGLYSERCVYYKASGASWATQISPPTEQGAT